MIDERRIQEDFQKYLSFLRRYASESRSELIMTGGIEHAAILMSVLLDNTEQIVRIYCYGFRPDLMIREPLNSAWKKFLDKKYNKLMILVDSSDYINEAPLKMVKKYIKQRNDDSIQVKLLSEEYHRKICEFFGDIYGYFSVFDSNKYRRESISEEFKSISSFNDPEYCSILINLFDDAFHKSSLIF